MAYRIKGDVLVARDLTASGSISVPSGSASAPSIKFIDNPSTGIYEPSSGQIGFTVGGSGCWKFNGAGDFVPLADSLYDIGSIGISPAFIFADRYSATNFGTVSNTTFGWAASPGDGLYLTSSNIVAIAVSGSDAVVFDNTGANPQALFPNGSIGAPSISFVNNTDTGIYLTGTSLLDFALDGIRKLRITSNAVTANDSIYLVDGTAGAPGIAFASDTDTGIFRSEDGSIDFTNDGTSYWKISGSGELITVAGAGGRLLVEVGSSGTPSIAWRGDDDTGFYRGSINNISIVCGGADVAAFGSTFLRPLVDAARDLGTSSFHWRDIFAISAEGATTSGPSLTGYSLTDTGTNAGAYSIGIDNSLLSNVGSNVTDLMTALDQIDASIAGVTGSTAAYTDSFGVVDWQITGSNQVYTISGSTHGLETDNMQIQVYRSGSGGFTLITPQETQVNSNFDVQFTISSGSAFQGQAILLKSGISSVTVVDQFADSGNLLSTTSSLQYGSNVSASNQLTFATTTTTGSETVAALSIPVSGNRVYDMDFTILAAGTGSGITKRFKRNLAVYDYGSPAIIGDVAYAIVPDVSGSSAAATADVDFAISANNLVCYVSGVVSESISWTVNAFITKGEN